MVVYMMARRAWAFRKWTPLIRSTVDTEKGLAPHALIKGGALPFGPEGHPSSELPYPGGVGEQIISTDAVATLHPHEKEIVHKIYVSRLGMSLFWAKMQG